MVQITTVSMKGSKRATNPSEAGYFVFTAAWAMEADPAPASLEKAARRKPVINTPKSPPSPAFGLNACEKIITKASSTKLKLVDII